ncbi:MAG: hypothetical protein JKY54_12075 [Flavobacteriales bacterium]|nr:hypothetical protein [Flavobacteriales bacterium]
MNKILLLSTFLLSSTALFAQKQIDYFNPPAVISEDLSVTLSNIFSDNALCKLKLIVANKSTDSYLIYNTDKTGFNFEGLGTYYPEKSKEMIIGPGDKKYRVVKITDNDYRIPKFIVQAEGLMGGAIPDDGLGLQAMSIQPGSAQLVELARFKVQMEAPSLKKGSVSAQLEISFNGTKNQLLVFDPNKVRIQSTSGQAVPAEIGKGKLIELRPGDKKKVKISFTENANSMVIAWNDAIKLINLESIEITPINISSVDKSVKASTVGKVNKEKTKQPKSKAKAPAVEKPVAVTAPPTPAPAKITCSPYKGAKDEKVKFSVRNETGRCFKLDVDGFPVITENTSAAIIYVDYGRKIMKFTFDDGSVVQEKTWVTDSFDALGVKVKVNKKGVFNIKNDLGAQVLSEKGKQERSDQMARTEANREKSLKSLDEPIVVKKPTTTMLDKVEFESDKPAEPKKTTASTGSTGASGASASGGSGCFGAHTSGGTTIKLKVTWKGSPVANSGIQIKVGGGVVGVGQTDGSGVANINAGNLPTRKIDVYGCKGSKNWSVTGDWCVLDGSNYFHLKLDEVAAFMGEMMGMSADQIGAGWGM